MAKQLFISHAWGNDGLNRDNHKRCKQLYEKLIEKNYSVWIDDNEMYGNIDSAIMKGINNAKVILICLTESYCKKINNAVVNNLPNDNCYKEWNYGLFKQKLIIPIIMEPQMRDIYLKQDGIVQMYFNSTLYIDASEDLDHATKKICFTLKNNCIYGHNFVNKFKNMKKLDSILTLINLKSLFSETLSLKSSISPNKYKSPKSIMQTNLARNNDGQLSRRSNSINSIDNTPIRHSNRGRLSPLSIRSDNILNISTSNQSIINSPIARRLNSFECLSPINKLVTSNRLSPIDLAIQREMTINITREIEKNLKKDFKKDLAKDLAKDLKKDFKKDLAKDLKKDMKKDMKKDINKNINKNIQKNLLTGMIINNTINTDDSSEINTSSDKETTSESEVDTPKHQDNVTHNNFTSLSSENNYIIDY